jgi:chemotaxis protein methyltransferase CheR
MELEVYADVKRMILSMLHLDLNHYKDEQMQRRLDSWLIRSGIASWDDYFLLLSQDNQESMRFRDYLTINVSSFFRDPERWQQLEDNILPDLLKETIKLRPTDSGLRIWSAGCSIGAEAYSIAILLDKLSPIRRHIILATDFDRTALKKARDGGPYTREELQNLTPVQRAEYLIPGGPPFFIQKNLGRKVQFQEHNILADPFPDGMDLIICRNVVIYFTGKSKDCLYKNFYTALRQGGLMFIGATEIIPHPHEIGLKSTGISFYQKI